MELLRKCWWPKQKLKENHRQLFIRPNSWTKFIAMPIGAVACVRVVSMKDMLNLVVMGGVLVVERIIMTTSSVTCCVDENVNECDYSIDERPYVRLHVP